MVATRCSLSSRSSSSMSAGWRLASSLSCTRWHLAIWPIDLIVFAAHFSDPLGDCVGCRENLLALVVKQQMIIAEMRPRNVPVKVLRLDVEGKHVRQKPRESRGKHLNGIVGEAGRGLELSNWDCPGSVLVISSISGRKVSSDVVEERALASLSGPVT
jgi:hypothetical protein